METLVTHCASFSHNKFLINYNFNILPKYILLKIARHQLFLLSQCHEKIAQTPQSPAINGGYNKSCPQKLSLVTVTIISILTYRGNVSLGWELQQSQLHFIKSNLPNMNSPQYELSQTIILCQHWSRCMIDVHYILASLLVWLFPSPPTEVIEHTHLQSLSLGL